MTVTIKITNNINKVVPNIKKRILSDMFKAVLLCGGLVKKEAAIRAPSRKIANALKVVPRNVNGIPESNTGFAKGKAGFYGKFIESGTKKHDIEPKNGKILSWITASGGKVIFDGKKTASKYYVAKNGSYTLNASEQGRTYITVAHHPGIKAKPFLWPAFQSKIPEIKEVLSTAVITTSIEGAREGGG